MNKKNPMFNSIQAGKQSVSKGQNTYSIALCV